MGLELLDLVVSQNSGYLFGGPHNKDYGILESILGSPYLGKLPFLHKISWQPAASRRIQSLD